MGKQNENKDEFGYYRSDPILNDSLRRRNKFVTLLRKFIGVVFGQEHARSASREHPSFREPVDGAGLTREDFTKLQNLAQRKGIDALVTTASLLSPVRVIQCEVCGNQATVVVEDLMSMSPIDPTQEVRTLRQPHYYCMAHVRDARLVVITDADEYA